MAMVEAKQVALLLAAHLFACGEDGEQDALEGFAQDLALMLKSNNPEFDEIEFLTYIYNQVEEDDE